MIVVNEEFKSIIPPLSKDEFKQLEANIIKDGCRDPLVLWNNTLIDGHNRFDICTRNGIEFGTVSKDFDCSEDVVVWMIDNQEGRRNLNNFQRTELQLRKKSAIAAKAKANQVRKPVESVYQISDKQTEPVHALKEIAKAANVSHDTVHKVETILKKAEPEIAQAVRENRISINLASQVAELPKEEQRVIAEQPADEIKEVAKEVVKKAHVANNSGNNEWYTPTEYIEAAREVMGSIDTDPATSIVANERVKATTIFTEEDDGRDKVWSGNVWMNPPYAQPLIFDFSNGLARRYDDGEISQACVLVNNGTETAWFQRMAKSCSAICFPKSRIRFVDPNGNIGGSPLQGQAVIYFGKNVDKFERLFSEKGVVVRHG